MPDGTVVVDPTVNRPQILPILREVRRTIGPDRMAALLATPIGDNLLRAVRTEDWALARSLLRQALADRVLTPAEASAIRDVAQEYEADLE